MWDFIVNVLTSALSFGRDLYYSIHIEGVPLMGFMVIIFVLGLSLRFFVMPFYSGVKGDRSDTVKRKKENKG